MDASPPPAKIASEQDFTRTGYRFLYKTGFWEHKANAFEDEATHATVS